MLAFKGILGGAYQEFDYPLQLLFNYNYIVGGGGERGFFFFVSFDIGL